MKYTIVPSKRFAKTLKKLQKGGKRKLLKLLSEVLELLIDPNQESAFILGMRWRDHPLKGDQHGIRELHLSQDDLLLYEIDEEQSVIKLLDIVSHEQLRKM